MKTSTSKESHDSRQEPSAASLAQRVEQSPLVEHFEASPRLLTQRKDIDAMFGGIAQRVEGAPQTAPQENDTGMPDRLKSGIEALSGMDMSDVRVHRNSDQPAQLQALAYAQGNDIHLGPGQDHHLPHEAWHVVQQRQGRVQPTMQLQAVGVNDDEALEREADVMGTRAAQYHEDPVQTKSIAAAAATSGSGVVQRATEFLFKTKDLTYDDGGGMMQTDTVGYEADAWIDPSNAVAGTTTPARTGVYQDMNLIQGHLVNAQVGGPGRTENFFPITASMNAQHKNNIELPLKHRVVELYGLQQAQQVWRGRRLHYKVQVVPQSWNNFDAAAQTQTQFNCTFEYVGAQNQRLTSQPFGTLSASDTLSAMHTNLDQELTNMGAGAAGPPTTTAGGGRHYTLGAVTNLGGGVTLRDLMFNGAKIGEVEAH